MPRLDSGGKLMPQTARINPEPFHFSGGSTGVLLVHGFIGSPVEMRDMGGHLASRGLSVRGIRLRGHGANPRDMARCRWQEWRDDVSEGVNALRQECQTIYLAGLSMGGALVLLRAAGATDIAGVVAMAPALKVAAPLGLTRWFRYLMPYVLSASRKSRWRQEPAWKDRVWSYDWVSLAAVQQLALLINEATAALPQVRVPTLILHGLRDPTVPPSASIVVHNGIASTDKRLIWLPKSGHILPADEEREFVWETAANWILERGI